MFRSFACGLLGVICLLAEPASKPIPKVYIVAVNGLAAQVQSVTKQAQEAVAEYEADLCGSLKLKRDVCLVDWQKGTVGAKPKDEPNQAEKPKP